MSASFTGTKFGGGEKLSRLLRQQADSADRHRYGFPVYNNYAIANLLYKTYSRIHLYQTNAIAAYRRQLR